MNARVVTAALLLFTAAAAPALAGLGPVAPANLAPQHLFLLEPPPEMPQTVERRALSVDVDYASIYFHVQSHDDPKADLDMEVARVLLSYAQLLPWKVEARLDVPVLWRGPGFLDGFINAFHRAFDLPSGTKNDAPMNEYHYDISSGDDSYSPDSGYGLGDVVLRFKREIPAELPLDLRFAGRAMVKLPTGSPSRGFGSGKTDASAGLVAAMGPAAWSLFGALDVVYLGGSPGSLFSMNRHWALKASGGGGLRLWSLGELTLQVEYFTTPYDTGEKSLDRDVSMLTLAFQRQNASGLKWSFGATEDLASRASPDFGMFVHTSYPF